MKPSKSFIIVTALFCLAVTASGVANILQPPMVVEEMQKLGLPLPLLTLVGAWKLLGVAALASPRFKLLNEWAYAGFVFDLTGAAWLHASAGDFPGIPAPLILLGVLLTSYKLRRPAENAPAKSAGAPVPSAS